MTYPNPFPPPQRGLPVPRKRHWWPWAVVAVGAALLLAAVVGVAASPAGGKAPTQNRPGVGGWTGSATATSSAVLTPDTWTIPTTAAAGPLTSFSSGTWEVGTDIQPGKYKTPGPTGGGSCYWARLKTTDGSFDSIITNGNPEGPATVTISKNDAAFETSGGCTWTKAG